MFAVRARGAIPIGYGPRMKTRNERLWSWTASLSALLVFAGCGGRLGPATVSLTRTHYNVAAQETSAQELLLNLVRLRYRDAPYFLQIASLSTNMRARAGIGAEATFVPNGADSQGITGSLSIEESPTVTYTPLVGDRFVSQILEPVEPEILLLLSHAGWSMDRFLRLFVQEIGGVPNAPTASGPTPAKAPVFEEFLRVAELFRVLQSRRQLQLIGGSLGGRGAETPRATEDGVLIRFSPEALETDEFKELQGRLGLEPGREIFELVSGIGARAPHRINLVVRSVLSAMFYASHGIRVPEADREGGRVTTTLSPDGEAFDWDRVTGSLIDVESGRPPETPYAWVRYRGHTFWIDDADLDSKSTFTMLNLVLALQAGEVPTGGPILTLPVAQ
ncbi:MAG: hypothetical protein AAGC67_15310 [Myxococcota bacterium]